MRAILIELSSKNSSREDIIYEIEELEGLVEALEGVSLGYVLQKVENKDPAYFLSKGKLSILKDIIKGTNASHIIINDFITPSQLYNLEKFFNIKVMDRADVILEIFTKRAKTKESKLEIELARLRYELPRLYGWGEALSRIGAGAKTRGPGEQEYEIKRRAIKKRIDKIKQELKEIQKSRNEQRKWRTKDKTLKVALIGYTNAGKSSVMKALTGKDVFTSDMLFATIDTKTSLGKNVKQKILITDTVGFISKMPKTFIDSFRTTIEEIFLADVLAIVVDVSDKNWIEKLKSLEDILKELGLSQKKKFYILNKVDKLKEDLFLFEKSLFLDDKSFLFSAKTGYNKDRVLEYLESLYELVYEGETLSV